jgi:hypothetical protein
MSSHILARPFSPERLKCQPVSRSLARSYPQQVTDVILSFLAERTRA